MFQALPAEDGAMAQIQFTRQMLASSHYKKEITVPSLTETGSAFAGCRSFATGNQLMTLGWWNIWEIPKIRGPNTDPK